MRSLFAQLWLAFLAVTAATFVASLLFGYGAALKRSSEANLVSPAALAQSAQQALDQGGTDGLDGWIVSEVHRQPEISVYFVDRSGREFLGRTVHGQPLPASAGRRDPLVRTPDGTVLTLQARRVRGVVFDFWRMLLGPWVLGAIILVISGAGCAFLAWQMTRPVRQLRAAVREVAAGRLDVEVEPRLADRGDELGWLARDFRQMAHDLRKLISSKENLLRDVSHELRSPLLRLRLAADLARSGVGDPAEAFQRIDREVERIDSMIGQILEFARIESAQRVARQVTDLGELIQRAVEDVGIEAAARGVRLGLLSCPQALADVEPSKLLSAIDNVLRNAIHHAPSGSAIEIQLLVEPENITIVVSDRGPGIRDADEAKIFEPFHRGSNSNGAGLGLAIAKNVMEQHGGIAIAENRAGGGLEVELMMPRSIPDSPGASAELPPLNRTALPT